MFRQPVGRLFENGVIIDFVLGFMAVELMLLILVRKKPWASGQVLELVVNMGAGAALLLALRASLRTAAWPLIALWLIVALGFHLWELTLRGSLRRTR